MAIYKTNGLIEGANYELWIIDKNGNPKKLLHKFKNHRTNYLEIRKFMIPDNVSLFELKIIEK